jgi:hypothetical protein
VRQWALCSRTVFERNPEMDREKRWGIVVVVSALMIVAISGLVCVGLPVISVVVTCPLLQPGSAQSSAGQQQRSSLQWGLFQEGAPANLTKVDQLSSTLGKKPQILHWYVNWGEVPSSAELQAARGAGATPMITWEAWGRTTAGIAAGQNDADIDGFANAVKGGDPVSVRIFHEFNDAYQGGGGGGGAGYPWSAAGSDGSALNAAWKHTVDRMKADGATNVRWVWNPDDDIASHPIPPNAYPGDEYVDYAGFDWYDDAGPFQADYDAISKISSKPQIIGEIGARDASSISTLQREIQGGKVPKLQALVWFDNAEWRLEANSPVQGAVKSLLQAAPQGQGGGQQVLGMGASGEQNHNAAAIVAEVKREGLPDRAAVIAVATALQESGLRDLPNGDRDSVGLFQQRPSQGWGTPQQIQDPAYATKQFLQRLPGDWQSSPVGTVAQSIQRSSNAAGDLFGRWEGEATQLVQQLWGGTQAGQQPQGRPQPTPFCPAFQPRGQGQPEASPIPRSGLPFPIPGTVPAPGWKQPIPVPAWPLGLPGTRVNPPAITPQCVAGALWAWAAAHLADPAFSHPPPMNVASAYQMTAEAQRAGFKMDSAPQTGDMVVFRNGGFYGANGHVGLVIATAGDHYLVAEQNFTNTVEDLGPHWGSWDIRSIGWPDAQASGFIAAPPA